MKQNQIISISSRLGGGGGWMGCGGGWGCPPHMCTCMHACTHTHACVVNMIISCKWPPPLDLGKSRGFPMMSYAHVHACTCVHVHVCTHVWGYPLTTLHPPPNPLGGTPRISQNSIALELINISILFEDL